MAGFDLRVLMLALRSAYAMLPLARTIPLQRTYGYTGPFPPPLPPRPHTVLGND